MDHRGNGAKEQFLCRGFFRYVCMSGYTSNSRHTARGWNGKRAHWLDCW